ncbi:RagB/SusD family nutrient uptake outer membrane protein [Pedobacter caeni]|uniref:SusD family protein n=1 Tax=Pedobacter caeni TaxID=288992 RepID=A0A1M5HBA0_9SPHI|nr:RagB/SusD family nutrient uptake outer membrane protein [Pedobacter caeni]SHG13211.1 SusD family protein [Pedobacter caeni]
MKKIFYLNFIAMLVLLSSGCKKMLDIKPVNSMMPVTIADYESVLLGGYPKLDFYFKTELMTDNAFVNLQTINGLERANEPWYVWAASHQMDGVADDPYWGQLYRSVYYANTVLDEFSKRSPSSADKVLFETVMGEAYALRAFSYFYLVNLYADVYAPETLAGQGVPMPLSALDVHQHTQNNVREPIEKVWGQIRKDIDQAGLLLMGKPEKGKYRFNYNSLQLFNARVKLFTGDNEGAIAASTIVMNTKGLFNMNETQAHIDEENQESYAFTSNYGMIDSDYKNEVLFFMAGRANNNIFYHGMNACKPAVELLDLCRRNGVADYRRYIFDSFADLNTADGVQTGPTIYNMFAKQENGSYHIGLKVSEAYVTRAEAYARLGRKELAIADLNNLLLNRIKKGAFVPLTLADFASQEDLLKRIYEERRVETAFEGGLRWFDLRRLGKPALTHVYKNGQVYTLKEKDPRYILQIPLSEQINSPEMPINKR